MLGDYIKVPEIIVIFVSLLCLYFVWPFTLNVGSTFCSITILVSQ